MFKKIALLTVLAVVFYFLFLSVGYAWPGEATTTTSPPATTNPQGQCDPNNVCQSCGCNNGSCVCYSQCGGCSSGCNSDVACQLAAETTHPCAGAGCATQTTAGYGNQTFGPTVTDSNGCTRISGGPSSANCNASTCQYASTYSCTDGRGYTTYDSCPICDQCTQTSSNTCDSDNAAFMDCGNGTTCNQYTYSCTDPALTAQFNGTGGGWLKCESGSGSGTGGDGGSSTTTTLDSSCTDCLNRPNRLWCKNPAACMRTYQAGACSEANRVTVSSQCLAATTTTTIVPTTTTATTTTLPPPISNYVVSGVVFVDNNPGAGDVVGKKDSDEVCYGGDLGKDVLLTMGINQQPFKSFASCNTYSISNQTQCAPVQITVTGYNSTGWYGTDATGTEISGGGKTAYICPVTTTTNAAATTTTAHGGSSTTTIPPTTTTGGQCVAGFYTTHACGGKCSGGNCSRYWTIYYCTCP